MNRKLVLALALTLLVGLLSVAFNVRRAKATGTIYIRADGSIDPPTATISTVDNVTYTFTGNIYDSIVVERDNIMIDGAGYTMTGSRSGNGATLTDRSNVTVRNTTIKNFYYGTYLNHTNKIALINNDIANNGIGILLNSSLISIVSGNNITASSENGIRLMSSNNNTLSGNSLAKNGNGIFLTDGSSNNTLSCNNVTTSDGSGIVLYSSHNTLSSNNIIASKVYGVGLFSFSYGNFLLGNNVTMNRNGILLDVWTGNNVLSGNNVAANDEYGIRLYSSSYNALSGNNITRNKVCGVWLCSSSYNNVFYHNNFMNNGQHVYIQLSDYANSWDNGVEGNYWNDHNGTDANHDGIGDTPYVTDANNTDNYPLMGVFTEFNATSEQHVQTICNSTISDFQFNGTAISFNVSGENDTTGFCRIRIPTALMNAIYKVFVNGTEVSYNSLPCSDETYSYLYFNYTHSTQDVIIIPESPSFLILPLFFISTLLAVTIYRRKHPQDE